jgi:predicted transcriptional regulator
MEYDNDMSTTLRVSEETRAHAASLAQATGQSIGTVVSRALVEYERAEFWSATAAALARGSAAGRDRDDDAALWERTNRDGMDRD